MSHFEKEFNKFVGLWTGPICHILRDLILNITPPAAFRDPAFAVTAIIVSVLIFIRPFEESIEKRKAAYEKMLLVMDSIGLGLFTVIGIEVAKSSGTEPNMFLESFVGVMTGEGNHRLTPMLLIKVPDGTYYYSLVIMPPYHSQLQKPLAGVSWL